MFRSHVGAMVLAANLLSGMAVSTAMMMEEPQKPGETKKAVPSYEVKLVPVQPPKGADAYPEGTTIKDDELRFPSNTKGSCTAYFKMEVGPKEAETDVGSTATEVINEPLRGHCCTESQSDLGVMTSCKNVYTAAQQTECEEGGGFHSGTPCGTGLQCLLKLLSFSATVYVVPPSECRPIFLPVPGPCKFKEAHLGGGHHPDVPPAGANYSNSSDGGGIDEMDCFGAMRFEEGVIADCMVVTVRPDAEDIKVLDSKGRRLAVQTKGMKIVFEKPPASEKK